jgi:hypothetical protein
VSGVCADITDRCVADVQHDPIVTAAVAAITREAQQQPLGSEPRRHSRSGPHDPRIPDALEHYASGAAPLAAQGHRFFQEIAFFFKTRAWVKFQNARTSIDAISGDGRHHEGIGGARGRDCG